MDKLLRYAFLFIVTKFNQNNKGIKNKNISEQLQTKKKKKNKSHLVELVSITETAKLSVSSTTSLVFREGLKSVFETTEIIKEF